LQFVNSIYSKIQLNLLSNCIMPKSYYLKGRHWLFTVELTAIECRVTSIESVHKGCFAFMKQFLHGSGRVGSSKKQYYHPMMDCIIIAQRSVLNNCTNITSSPRCVISIGAQSALSYTLPTTEQCRHSKIGM